jgi:TatD DNase family protein
MLTDTHCHLDFDRFAEDREAVMERASDTGLVRLLNPAIDLATAQHAVRLSEKFSVVYAAVGLHPNSALEWKDSLSTEFRDMAKHEKVVAIGEIGLDYYWDKAPRDVQHRVLQQQLELAAEVDLPVIIHNREATQDVLSILLEWQRGLSQVGHPLAQRPGVLHSFSADVKAARQAIAANFYIGITGPVTFKNAPQLQALVRTLPLNRLLIETDAPFLTPHPFRGKRNEPARVRLVAEKIAELKGLEIDEVIVATGENARRLFLW